MQVGTRLCVEANNWSSSGPIPSSDLSRTGWYLNLCEAMRENWACTVVVVSPLQTSQLKRTDCAGLSVADQPPLRKQPCPATLITEVVRNKCQISRKHPNNCRNNVSLCGEPLFSETPPNKECGRSRRKPAGVPNLQQELFHLQNRRRFETWTATSHWLTPCLPHGRV